MKLTVWLTACTRHGCLKLWRPHTLEEVDRRRRRSSAAQNLHVPQQQGEADPSIFLCLQPWCSNDILHEMCISYLNNTIDPNLSAVSYACLSQCCLSSQSVSTSDASAEVAVFCNVDSEPREAAAAGPPSASALQLHQRSGRQQQHRSSSESWALHLPPGPHGNTRGQQWCAVTGSGLMVLSSWFQEFYVPCTLSRKPLLILHFILQMKLSPILCFTNSREAAHRFSAHPTLKGFNFKSLCFSSCVSSADFISWLSCLEVWRWLSSHPDSLLLKGRTRLRIFNKETSSCEFDHKQQHISIKQ